MCIRDSYYDDKTVRDNFDIREIPDNMKAEAEEWRNKLIEEVEMCIRDRNRTEDTTAAGKQRRLDRTAAVTARTLLTLQLAGRTCDLDVYKRQDLGSHLADELLVDAFECDDRVSLLLRNGRGGHFGRQHQIRVVLSLIHIFGAIVRNSSVTASFCLRYENTIRRWCVVSSLDLVTSGSMN